MIPLIVLRTIHSPVVAYSMLAESEKHVLIMNSLLLFLFNPTKSPTFDLISPPAPPIQTDASKNSRRRMLASDNLPPQLPRPRLHSTLPPPPNLSSSFSNCEHNSSSRKPARRRLRRRFLSSRLPLLLKLRSAQDHHRLLTMISCHSRRLRRNSSNINR